jgi:hypothetical protein
LRGRSWRRLASRRRRGWRPQRGGLNGRARRRPRRTLRRGLGGGALRGGGCRGSGRRRLALRRCGGRGALGNGGLRQRACHRRRRRWRDRGAIARRERARRSRRLGRRNGGRSCCLRSEPRLDLGDRRVERVLLASDVAFRQRRAQSSQLGEQSLARAIVNGSTRRRSAGVGQIRDGSHEQRMIISHKAYAQPLCGKSPRVP